MDWLALLEMVRDDMAAHRKNGTMPDAQECVEWEESLTAILSEFHDEE